MALRITGRLVNPTGIKATILVPTYQLTSNVNSVNEGNPIVFTLTTTNIPNGTLVPYTITGLTSADIVGGQLTGNFTVNVFGIGTTTITVSEDAIADEVESLTMTIDGTAVSKTVTITDTTVLDQYLNYNSFLLTASGVNATNNNTFVDSSTNNYTITRNGNTTQGSFSPRSASPGYWGAYFNNTANSSVYIPSNAAFAQGTGDFTIECWANVSTTAVTYQSIIQIGQPGVHGFYLGIENSIIQVIIMNGGTAITYSIPAGWLGKWHHLAVTRQGTALTLWIDGISVGTATNSANITQYQCNIGGASWASGTNLRGCISNVRIVKGTALYTSAFTPASNPLTAVTNTVLLILQDNTFKDNSVNNFSLSTTGRPSMVPYGPFNDAAYSVEKGGSVYFDGSGDYLTVTGVNSVFTGTTWTVEMWAYINPIQNTQNGINLQPHTTLGISFNRTGIGDTYVYTGNGSSWLATPSINSNTSGKNLILNAWNHIALVRNGSTITLYHNGKNAGTTSLMPSGINTSSFMSIGSIFNGTPSEYFYGNLTDVRVTNTAVYTSEFATPTSSLTAISGTQLLLKGTNANIIDSTGKNIIETVGNARVNTSVVKYNKSVYFDGVDDWLYVPTDTPLFGFGFSDFTIEFWAYRLDNGLNWLIDFRTPGSGANQNKLLIYADTLGQCVVNIGSSTIIIGTALESNAWHHFALTRSSGNIKLFVNGVQRGSTYSTITDLGTSATLMVGTVGDAPGFNDFEFNGYIEDLRITKGVARYTTTFTPPTAALPR